MLSFWTTADSKAVTHSFSTLPPLNAMTTTLKNATKQVLSKFGIYVSKNHKYDALALRIMRTVLRPDSVCVDIGAHKGEFLDDILELSPKGTHYGFEPIPGMFAELSKKYEGKSNVHLHNCALSDAPGQTTFEFVVSNPAYSGLKRRKYVKEEKIEQISVELLTLDDVIPSDTNIDFIKVDVEGAELQVLRGARQHLTRSKPVVVFEHGLGASDHYGTTPDMMYSLLVDECGLVINLMDRFLAKAAPLSRSEFCDQFNKSMNYYFVAYPQPAA